MHERHNLIIISPVAYPKKQYAFVSVFVGVAAVVVSIPFNDAQFLAIALTHYKIEYIFVSFSL